MHLFGGGYAQTGDRERPGIRSAQANVGGNITISAEEDASADTGQKNETAFSRFFGGGFAQGPYSSANVEGNTNIVTVRPAWESNMGIVGGGDAVSGEMCIRDSLHVFSTLIQADLHRRRLLFFMIQSRHSRCHADPQLSDQFIHVADDEDQPESR